jgi:H+/Cl- antiporter ClcA
MSGFQPSWGSGGNGIELNMPHLWMFFFIYFMFTITTFGVSVPSGWSFPALVTGCTLGAIYEATRIYLMAETMDEYTITPLIVGSAAMLSGSLHLTYSVVILSVEMSS